MPVSASERAFRNALADVPIASASSATEAESFEPEPKARRCDKARGGACDEGSAAESAHGGSPFCFGGRSDRTNRCGSTVDMVLILAGHA